MWKELCQFAPALGDWSEQSPPNNLFITIKDELAAEGSFILHFLSQMYMRGGHRVVLVSLSQSWTHYSTIARKLGVTGPALTSGQLSFIDGFSCPFAWCEPGVTPTPSATNPLPPTEHFSLDPSIGLQPLMQMISKAVQTRTQEKCLVLIDDLTSLSLSVSPEAISDFVHYCSSLAQHPGTSVAVLWHADCTDEAGDRYLRSIEHLADVRFEVMGLETGYSRDVHGQLLVTVVDERSQTPSPPVRVRYKITEAGVKLFSHLETRT
eukprot:GILJ01003496.1.p1 GENE.GILJ01003496.1~~GILJ01003496.1.p1  ORF type:complete len:265 (-),score=29.34 GILJ01003496.1:120-914(-)